MTICTFVDCWENCVKDSETFEPFSLWNLCLCLGRPYGIRPAKSDMLIGFTLQIELHGRCFTKCLRRTLDSIQCHVRVYLYLIDSDHRFNSSSIDCWMSMLKLQSGILGPRGSRIYNLLSTVSFLLCSTCTYLLWLWHLPDPPPCTPGPAYLKPNSGIHVKLAIPVAAMSPSHSCHLLDEPWQSNWQSIHGSFSLSIYIEHPNRESKPTSLGLGARARA